jgi:hypothetical protein
MSENQAPEVALSILTEGRKSLGRTDKNVDTVLILLIETDRDVADDGDGRVFCGYLISVRIRPMQLLPSVNRDSLVSFLISKRAYREKSYMTYNIDLRVLAFYMKYFSTCRIF